MLLKPKVMSDVKDELKLYKSPPAIEMANTLSCNGWMMWKSFNNWIRISDLPSVADRPVQGVSLEKAYLLMLNEKE